MNVRSEVNLTDGMRDVMATQIQRLPVIQRGCSDIVEPVAVDVPDTEQQMPG